MRVWDLCSGTGSVSRVWADAGHETLTLDVSRKCAQPDICADILTWEYTDFSLAPPDVIWCSPPCIMYSRARTHAKTPRDLDGADALVQRCLDIIDFWHPRFWILENPQTGLLKTRDVIQGLPWKDVDYCSYQDPVLCRKRTRLWTNCTDWVPRPPCAHVGHPHSAQTGPQRVRGTGLFLPDDVMTLQTLHQVPRALTTEIMRFCENEMRN